MEICTRMAEGKPLTKVCKQRGMPSLTTVYAWRGRYHEFDLSLRRARADLADTLFAQAIEIADEKCVDATAVQRNRLRVDTRKWAAGKMNARLYGDQLALGGAEDLPPIRVGTNKVEEAKRLAFVLARAGHLIQQQSQPALAAAPAPARLHLERIPEYRPIMTSVQPSVDYDREEDEDAIGRIGDPARAESKPRAARQPLSARLATNQPDLEV